MLLDGLLQFRNTSPQIFLSTFDAFRAAVNCTLQQVAAEPIFTSVLTEPPFTLIPAPPAVQTLNCTYFNDSFPLQPQTAGARVAAWYKFPNTSQVMSMNLVQFNTMMTYSPYIQAYKQIVGSTGIIAAGPAELLHLPGPVPYNLPISANVKNNVSYAALGLVFITFLMLLFSPRS